ncbi:PREDICTED: cytochrome P450 CYP82D47-like [Erythranthe guttata]|uniref:cytochrome P450 CYP82D47-like n=1 Tax=Erythranthe guttata TaxID=4155 RepID=UPI00064DD4C5|nr:PREDICTED: cytochrome P450 CYP82D47-like [Erythranthe guttata]|eukprot:XP_012856169.1 PREDICTED: cytochrome P450 CYP82D47-like [Erythranthe guttata]
MDFVLIHVGAMVSTLLFLALLCNLWRKHPRTKSNNVKKTSSPPQPIGAWPIVGHLHLLNCQNHIAQALAALADKYGPTFTLQLGMQRAVFVSSHEAIKEWFTVKDKLFAHRPKSSAGEHLVYNNNYNNHEADFGFKDGPYWSEMRKLLSLEAISKHSNKIGVYDVINTSIGRLYFGAKSARPVKVIIRHWVEEMTSDIVVRLIVGKRYEIGDRASEEESFRRLIREVAELSGQFVPSDVIPIPLLRWMDFGGKIKDMKRVSKELECLIEDWIDGHDFFEKRLTRGEGTDDWCFLDVMLSSVDDRFKFIAPQETIIKTFVVSMMSLVQSCMQNVILGLDTTSVYLTRLLSAVISNKEVMKLAQEEIDMKVGKQRWVQESDLNDLPYLYAVIKETLRLYPPLPLTLPHEASENCQLSGYLIPKGTQLFVNLWKLHRDPQFWPEPEKFMPERFLKGHNEDGVDFIPFGCGRRSCPGATFALRVVGFAMARLLHGFDFAAPVCMDEGLFDITTAKANPVEMMVNPRLSSQLYEQL